MRFSWKSKIIFSNLMTNQSSQIINVLALGTAMVIFALFSGFYLAQKDTLSHQQMLFPEYLAANIEKSETVTSESEFLVLRKVTRPTVNEIDSLLNQGIKAEIALNYVPLLSGSEMSIHGKVIDPYLPILLRDFELDSNQEGLFMGGPLNEEESTVFINEKMLEIMDSNISYTQLNDVSISFQGEFMIMDETYHLDMTFKIRGVFKELEYLSSPKIYFSQAQLDFYFLNQLLGNGDSVYQIIQTLSASDELTGLSYRLYFDTIGDMNKCESILSSLEDESEHLSLTSEHLSRVESLTEFFNFTNMVVIISLILVILCLVFINVTITNSEVKKANRKNALLFFFGAKFSDLIDIALGQNLIIVMISMISLMFVPFLSRLLNDCFYAYLHIQMEIKVPLLRFQGIPFLLPLLIFILVYLFASLTSIVLLFMKKQKTLIKRLAHND